MPIYEYQCDKCKNIFEELLNKDIPKLKCPIKGCNGTLNKLISFTNFRLKDGKSGWADNGYGDVKNARIYD